MDIEIYDDDGYLLGSLNLDNTAWHPRDNKFYNTADLRVRVTRPGKYTLVRLKLGNQSLESKSPPTSVGVGDEITFRAGGTFVAVFEEQDRLNERPDFHAFGRDAGRMRAIMNPGLVRAANTLRAALNGERSGIEPAARALLAAVDEFLGRLDQKERL